MMRAARAGRVALTTLLVVMLLGGQASGFVPTVSITWTPSGLATDGAVDAASPAIDGDLIAWEEGNNIKVRNLRLGATRTITSTGDVMQPDVSGDRVVYTDMADGDYDIKLYNWTYDSVTTVYDTDGGVHETMPRVDGTFVVWYDDSTGTVWGRDYDLGGYGPTLLAAGADYSRFDVDNGRLVVCSPADGNTYAKRLHPNGGGGWSTLADFAGNSVVSLEMHGSRLVVGTFDGISDYDVIWYDVRTDTVANVAVDGAVDEQRPSIFDYTTAFDVSGATAEIDYTWLGVPLIIDSPAFGGAEDDTNPSLYGHRIVYMRNDGLGDLDVLLATSNTKLQARTSGTTRFGTAAAVSRQYFSDAENVILCNGMNFPDALAAAPLARWLDAPLLLTRVDGLPPETVTEIARLAPDKIWVIGGEAAVNAAVYNQLDATYTMERVWGSNRYATSAAVAAKLESVAGATIVERAFFARGDEFPDALAVGPVAAGAVGPILLVQPNAVPPSVATAVDQLNIMHGYVIGSDNAVYPSTEDTLRALILANGAMVTPIERWGGTSRYDTAVAVANGGLQNRWIDLDTCGFAIGTNFPDALGGGSALGCYGSPLVLTSGTSLSGATSAFLDAHRYQIGRVDVFGGSDVFQPGVYNAIMAKIY